MTINIYLEKNKNVKNSALWIYVRGIGGTIKIHTSKYIEPQLWDAKRQRPFDFDGSSELDSYLVTLKETIKKEWRIIVAEKQSFNIETLRNRFNKIIDEILQSKKGDKEKPKIDSKNFFLSYDEFMDSKKDLLQHRTIQKYRTLKSHLIKFEIKSKFNISFDTINSEFYDKFVSFMIKDLRLTNNSIGKYISTLKTFMLWATDRGKTNKADFRKFEVFEEKSDIIYLTNDELMTIYNFDFSDDISLSQVRDFFCFGCFTGQRISDLEKLKWVDIKDNIWYVRTVKTRDTLEIPLIKKALRILKRYKDRNKPLPIISQQKNNEYIKVVCKQVGLNEPIKTVRYRGNEQIENLKPKYAYITTHTARRTFVTLSLEKGLRPEIVMEITGHKDYKTMAKYLKITSQVIKNEMLKAWKN